jgi:quercetin dioxygenase-like cupin family protein
MKITRLYVDAKGETHFEDVDIPYVESGAGGRTSKRYPAAGIVFRETAGTYDYDWHNAPRKQYIVNLDGAVDITVSDGETRRIGAGEVFLVEDVTGKGHISKAVDGKMRHSIFVPVD